MIKFSNPYLAFWGTCWALYNIFFGGNIFTYFMFGVCFGLIYQNYKDDKKDN